MKNQGLSYDSHHKAVKEISAYIRYYNLERKHSSPNVVPGTDEYGMPVAGPFFEQSIVELPNGDLLASMWGWFESDRTPSGYTDLWDKWHLKKSRSFLIRSKDKGRTWRYVATVAGDPDAGPEGFRLPSLALLHDGELLCLMRNGDGKRDFLRGARKQLHRRPFQLILTGMPFG